MLVDECDELLSSRVGGRSDRPYQVSVNNLKWVVSNVKVAGVGDTGNLALHAAITGTGLLKVDARKNRLEASNACMT